MQFPEHRAGRLLRRYLKGGKVTDMEMIQEEIDQIEAERARNLSVIDDPSTFWREPATA